MQLFYCILIGFFGLLVGSFLNVVIVRLPKMLQKNWEQECHEFLGQKPETQAATSPSPYNLCFPRSHCCHCQRQLSWYENIPLFSYIFLKGRCRSCKTTISRIYPVVELLASLVSFVVAQHFFNSPLLIPALILSLSLIVLSFIDFEHQILPDCITLFLLWLGLGLSAVDLSVSPADAILGAIAGYLSLWSIYWLFKFFTHKEGLGYGDFKLLALLGAWCGYSALPFILLIASVTGSIVGLTLILCFNRDRRAPLAFGPYIALGGWLTFMWSQPILSFYHHLVLW